MLNFRFYSIMYNCCPLQLHWYIYYTSFHMGNQRGIDLLLRKKFQKQSEKNSME